MQVRTLVLKVSKALLLKFQTFDILQQQSEWPSITLGTNCYLLETDVGKLSLFNCKLLCFQKKIVCFKFSEISAIYHSDVF